MVTLNDLINRIKKEVDTYSRSKSVKIEVSTEMFYKTIKLIQHMLRDKEDEPYRNVELSDKWKRFEVDINNKHFIFIKKWKYCM